MGVGAAASAILAASGVCRMRPGLTDDEITTVERRLQIRFSADHRDFLAAGLPHGPSWPNWRDGDEMELRSHLGVPQRGLMQAFTRGFWPPAWGPQPSAPAAQHEAHRLVATAPRMLPVYGYAFLVAGSEQPGTPVWSIDGAEVRLLGDLAEFIELFCARRAAPEQPWESAAAIGFWRDLLPNAPQRGADDADHPPLGVPPFPPDPVVAAPQAVAPPPQPAEVFAAQGVLLANLTRHDGVLALGVPMWTAATEPGAAAATLWASVRTLFPQTGLWPVLITERTWSRIGEEPDDPIAATLLSTEFDGAGWFADRYADHLADEPIPRSAAEALPPGEPPDWRSDWGHIYDGHRYTQLALVPAPAHWYVPGLLDWSGAANYDVGGADHATVLRRWSSRWAVELVALDDETMTLRVGDPPTDSSSALECAVEVYLYCPDTLDPHPDGVDVLAPSLTRRLWSFWWD